MAIAKIGVTEKEPEKRLVNAYRCSYESMRYPDLSLSPSSVSHLTKEIGLSRDLQLRFFHRYVDGSTHLIFDGTRLVCFSKDIDMARIGYNHSMIADPQINLMYCFSLRPAEIPIYFMPFAGNKPDISDIMASINELGLKDATLICDKRFYSKGNLDEMRTGGLRLITPLKRNSDDIDRPFLWGNEGSVLTYEGLFSYHERTIYYHVCQKFGKAEIQKRSHKGGRKTKGHRPEFTETGKDLVVLYLDSSFRTMEEEGYSQMMLLGKKDYSGDDMKENERYLGTITLRINSDMDPQELFEIYKERELIEDGNKAHKNVLNAYARI